MVDQYIFSGSLPENASTYVTREADADLYAGLTAGKFCYVLNSRQSGKSSLRVRTMQRLREDGVQCAAIDLSAGGIQNVPPEQWYADLIDTLIDSFAVDLDFGDWWEANQLNSLVTRFRKFIEEVLLVEVRENIVIFIDEIDSVLSLNFPTDDFFALIRACYNKRVDNPEYNRLTFCLLGVASPSNLIEDKQRTPFNIGQAISLKGFQLHEAEPLETGLRGKFSHPQEIMQEILQWTGGQPFLTQKLCQFMVEESEQENPRSVAEVVKSRIIENWESQDEPEHLRTIQARILRDEQRAGYLLELYQQVRLSEEKSEVTADDTLEQSELQLSGLVVRQQGKLKIYNQIYREIFTGNWIENQLKNLRPYAESFRFWVASGGVDDSRLLRGKALEEAEAWAKDKNLSYQDKQFLAASKEKEIQEEIAAKEKEAALERERKDREAAEARNQLLSQANKKAQQRISIGVVILVLAVLGAGIVGLLSRQQVKSANANVNEARKNAETAQDNERKAKVSAEQAKEQEKKARENEELARKKIVASEKTAIDAQQQEQIAKQSAMKFEEDAQTAKRNLETAQSDLNTRNQELSDTTNQLSLAQKQESEILAKLTNKETELNQISAKNEEAQSEVETVRNLVQLAGELRQNQNSSDSDEALRLAALSFNIEENHHLKQTLLFAAKSQAYQRLENWNKAKSASEKSNDYLAKIDKNKLNADEQHLQTQVLFYRYQGGLLHNDKKYNEAIKSYKTAFDLLNNYPNKTDFTKENQLITAENIEAVHRELIKLVSQNNTEESLKKEVEASLTKHLYAQLEYFLKANNWEAADRQTDRLMLNIARREEDGFFDLEQNNNFSCPDLRKIDQLWVSNSNQRFGFSVQKEIWINTGNRLGVQLADWTSEDTENYLKFAKAVGWYDENKGNETRSSRGEFVSYVDLMRGIKDNPIRYGGSLPSWHPGSYFKLNINSDSIFPIFLYLFFSHAATCKV
ncbi:AAA-like domain-containing protein [Nostoc sp. CCY0012]|uniref:AAA-like domain-containing protein n=1 Tax=Nostoc sp. CCY0012 TaxID=1056123 RepID=UPI0039C6FC04